MFLLNEILVFTPGRRQEALDRLAYIHSLMATKAGFLGAIVGRYQGDGIRHTVLRMWDDEGAYRRFRQGPDGDYGKGRPPGLYSNEPVTPQWNSMLQTGGTGGGAHLVKVQFEVPESAWQAYTDQQRRMEALIQSLGGLTHRTVLRAKDRPESLVVIRYRQRADWDRVLDSPEYATLQEEILASAGHLSTQSFEVVNEIGPA